jgi:hypothetical protein
MFGLSWLSVGIEARDTGEGTVSFRQIGQIALDGVDGALLARIKRHTEATGSAMLDRSPVAPLTLEGGARQRMGETGKVTGANPGQVNREVSQTEGQEATLQSLRTIRRRNCIAKPHATSPVAAMQFRLMMEWTRHASQPSA